MTAEQVRKGGLGVWAPSVMPPITQTGGRARLAIASPRADGRAPPRQPASSQPAPAAAAPASGVAGVEIAQPAAPAAAAPAAPPAEDKKGPRLVPLSRNSRTRWPEAPSAT